MAKYTFIINDESLNIGGFRVLTAGIELARFKNNPVVKVMHDSYSQWMPIGLASNLRIDDQNRLIADVEFDDEDEEAIKVEKKVMKKILRATSLGLKEIEWSDDMSVLQRSELLEISIVDVPANANTVTLHRKGKRVELSADNAEEIKKNNSKTKNVNTMIKLLNLLMSIQVGGAQVVNLSATSDEKEAQAQVQLGITQLSQKVTRLSAELNTSQAAQKKAEDGLITLKDSVVQEKANNLIELSVTAGKITAEKKEQWIKLAVANYEETKGILEGMKAHSKLSAQIALGASATKQNKEGKPLIELGYKELFKNHGAFLQELKASNPTVFTEKYEAEYGVKPNL